MTPQTVGSAAPAAQHPGCSTSADAGWAMLPHSIAADARLTAVDVRVLVALMYYARSRATCTPCDRSIGDRAGGISPGTVQRSLRRLEALGYLRREAVAPSDQNRTGRVIHLLWRCSSPGTASNRVTGTHVPVAGTGSTSPTLRGQTGGPATGERMSERRRATPRSPARDKGDVVVDGETLKTETDSALRPRPIPAPPVATPEVTPGTQPGPPGAPAPCPGLTTIFDLRAIGATPELLPGASIPTARKRPRLGLTLEELAKVAGDDPILAAELARRTAPPAPAEPPPATIPTVELFEALPGRHDLIMAAARRLCEETGDFKSASQRTFEQMAMAVATRSVPSAVLINCWRQGMGPKAVHRGKVLVSAWMRESQPYSTPMRR